MNTELQVSQELDTPLPFENLLAKDGHSGVTTSSGNVVSSQKPVKRQTRQWAAWTRQEEESFFNALRQVGKNFEKITNRVQSKNKDQVRHYYYRLVRRMNKLLGPRFSLDAKNSKDTNAAMLRWWSLLEKYSCKASKLHLKPRRFKIFIEALEHQLLKDRKKNIRRRPVLGENCPPGSPTTVPVHSKTSGQDTRSVKVVDGQNIQKVGSGKGSSVKRNVSTGINRSNSKGDSSTLRTARQRRKTGAASSAAYKRWEKAAIAGVSLVADAAEHLERTTDKMFFPGQGIMNESFPQLLVVPSGQKSIEPIGRDPSSLPLSACSQQEIRETSGQASVKLKLQLFPIDDCTRRALEKDEHNPHLELTLSARKRMSSVLDHLNRKWGNSSIASGELILFPYNIQRENLGGCQRWMEDTIACAAEVYASIGSPPVFRLRYGWFHNIEIELVKFQEPATSIHFQEEHRSMNVSERMKQSVDARPLPSSLTHHYSEQLSECLKGQPSPLMKSTTHMPSFTDMSEELTGYAFTEPDDNLQVSSTHSSWLRKETRGGNTRKQLEDLDNPRTSNGVSLSAREWADSLTNISIGDLLSDESRAVESTCINQPTKGGFQFLQQIPFSCDSFDAAIAAHISGHQDRSGLLSGPVQVSHSSSIWDAEETCDGFSFQKVAGLNCEAASTHGSASPGACKLDNHTNVMSTSGLVEELLEEQHLDDSGCEGDPMDNCEPNPQSPDNAAKAYVPDNSKDLNALTDIYWPDSLGPLDLDVPSPRSLAQDLMFGDSVSFSGLNRLIANSLDAFQNCSFFSLDKKELSSTADARATPSFSDYKIGEV